MRWTENPKKVVQFHSIPRMLRRHRIAHDASKTLLHNFYFNWLYSNPRLPTHSAIICSESGFITLRKHNFKLYKI